MSVTILGRLRACIIAHPALKAGRSTLAASQQSAPVAPQRQTETADCKEENLAIDCSFRRNPPELGCMPANCSIHRDPRVASVYAVSKNKGSEHGTIGSLSSNRHLAFAWLCSIRSHR